MVEHNHRMVVQPFFSSSRPPSLSSGTGPATGRRDHLHFIILDTSEEICLKVEVEGSQLWAYSLMKRSPTVKLFTHLKLRMEIKLKKILRHFASFLLIIQFSGRGKHPVGDCVAVHCPGHMHQGFPSAWANNKTWPVSGCWGRPSSGLGTWVLVWGRSAAGRADI